MVRTLEIIARHWIWTPHSLPCWGKGAHSIEGPEAKSVWHATPQVAHVCPALVPGLCQLEVSALPVVALKAVLRDGVPIIARRLPLQDDRV